MLIELQMKQLKKIMWQEPKNPRSKLSDSFNMDLVVRKSDGLPELSCCVEFQHRADAFMTFTAVDLMDRISNAHPEVLQADRPLRNNFDFLQSRILGSGMQHLETGAAVIGIKQQV